MGITSISTNIHAQYSSNNIRGGLDNIKASAMRLSSGDQITAPSDDAAGLSIGVGLRTDSSTLKAALKTSNQAISILQIADGGLENIAKILARLKSLASQSNSGAMGTAELGYIKSEMDALMSQIDNIVANTKFNGTKLLDGAYSAKLFQVGLTSSDTISVTLPQSDSVASPGLGLNAVDVTASGGIAAANTAVDTAINTVKNSRATVGALQSRFSYAAKNLETGINNLDASTSGYLDTDFATESTKFASEQAKLQAGIATLSKVNELPSFLLKLLS